MINPDLLNILRCPLDPSNTSLAEVEDKLVCQRCQIKFPVRDGIPVLIVDEAELPAGCSSVDHLPCQKHSPKVNL